MLEQIPEIKLPVITIIDDTPEDLYITKRFIEKFIDGVTVNKFSMATEALEYLQANSEKLENIPDIIFLDIHMPQMNGFEFLDAYATLPQSVKSKCTVYVLSSSFDSEDIKRANEHPNSKMFMEKPPKKEIVESILKEFYSKSN